MRLKPQVIDRCFLTAVTYVLAGTALFSKTSLAYHILEQGQAFSYICIGFLVFLNTVAALDLFINDILPPSLVWRLGIRVRQLDWLLMGVTFAGLGWVASRISYGGWVAAFYMLFALRCSSIAFVDLWLEFRELVLRRRDDDHVIVALL